MKTEEFDDAIKRKLESINPTFSEKDIERVHKYTVANRSPFSFLGSSRAFWTLMATGMLVTGLVTWKLTSMFVHTPATTVIVKTQPAPLVDQKSNPARIITKTDTIYVNKYINKYHDSYIKPQAVIDKKALATGKQYAELPIDDNREANGQLSTNEVVAAKKQNSISPIEPVADSKTVNPEAGKQTNNSSNDVKNQDPTTIVHSNSTTVLKNKDTVATPEKKEVVKNEIVKKAPVHNYADEHKLPDPDHRVNMNFMIGAGGEMTLANTQTGAGIFAKLLFNNTFSINTGLKLMSVNHQYYETDKDFQTKNGYPFTWAYAPDLGPWCTVKEISFTYSLWQLPLSLEYDLPIGHNFSISASVGTDIDLSCSNSLSFNYNEGYGGWINSTTSKTYPTIVFNDLVGSIGIIKQVRHFDFQLSPFINKLNEKVWYEGKNQVFYGANLKVFYCF